MVGTEANALAVIMQTILRTMVDYNYAEHRQLWQIVADLDEATFLQAPGYSIGCIQQEVVHIIRADRLWLSRAMETSDLTLLPYETVDRGEIRQAWDILECDVRSFLDSLSDQDLQRQVTYPNTRDIVQKRHVFELLLHICNHGTVHRAEMCAILHILGHTVDFDVSLRRYLEENS